MAEQSSLKSRGDPDVMDAVFEVGVVTAVVVSRLC